MKLNIFITAFTLLFSTNVMSATVTGRATVQIVKPDEISTFSGPVNNFEIVKTNKFISSILARLNKGFEYVQQLPESEYTITGSRDNDVQVKVISNNSKDNVQISDFELSYDNAVKGKKMPIKLNAKLKVKPAAKEGLHEPEFEVAVYYE